MGRAMPKVSWTRRQNSTHEPNNWAGKPNCIVTGIIFHSFDQVSKCLIEEGIYKCLMNRLLCIRKMRMHLAQVLVGRLTNEPDIHSCLVREPKQCISACSLWSPYKHLWCSLLLGQVPSPTELWEFHCYRLPRVPYTVPVGQIGTCCWGQLKFSWISRSVQLGEWFLSYNSTKLLPLSPGDSRLSAVPRYATGKWRSQFQ